MRIKSITLAELSDINAAARATNRNTGIQKTSIKIVLIKTRTFVKTRCRQVWTRIRRLGFIQTGCFLHADTLILHVCRKTLLILLLSYRLHALTERDKEAESQAEREGLRAV